MCSLMLNLLDNALEAASAAGVKRRYIKLDKHIQNNYFMFTCENGPHWTGSIKKPRRSAVWD